MNQMIRSARQLGQLIQNARAQQNLSQQALADLIGTGQKTISSVENGNKGTKLETVFSLMAALDLDIHMTPRSKSSKDIGDIF